MKCQLYPRNFTFLKQFSIFFTLTVSKKLWLNSRNGLTLMGAHIHNSPYTSTAIWSCRTVFPTEAWSVTLCRPSLEKVKDRLPSRVTTGWGTQRHTGRAREREKERENVKHPAVRPADPPWWKLDGGIHLSFITEPPVVGDRPHGAGP